MNILYDMCDYKHNRKFDLQLVNSLEKKIYFNKLQNKVSHNYKH